jgi:hypothetical protein
MAALEEMTPRSTAEKFFNLPPKEPKGVLLAPTINTFFVALVMTSRPEESQEGVGYLRKDVISLNWLDIKRSEDRSCNITCKKDHERLCHIFLYY